MLFNPYPYQAKAIDHEIRLARCALFLDMGLGKSVITLTAIRRLIDYCEVERVLVVAPKKVAETTWTTEAAKWDHLRSLRVVKVMGTAKQRRRALDTAADVYVTGRDSFVWLFEECKGRLPFDMIVIDELTSFKTPSAARFKAMRKASSMAARVVGLTGTPAPNGLIDLWAQMYCIDLGERLGKSVTRYRSDYFDTYMHNGIPVRCTLKKGAESTIRNKIADICLSMQAKDYLTLQPLIVHDIVVPLSPKVLKGYNDFEREQVMVVEESTVTAASAAALMNKLSQYASGAVYDENHGVVEIHSEKLDCLEELIASAGESVLVFYQYRHEAARIAARLKGKRVRTYEGEADLRAWNAGEIDVLLAHPASTAYGLNMQQGGRYIVWYGTGWNLEYYQQANARLHRQGQERPVIVYRLLAESTVDMLAVAALDSKQNVQQSLLSMLAKLTAKHDANA